MPWAAVLSVLPHASQLAAPNGQQTASKRARDAITTPAHQQQEILDLGPGWPWQRASGRHGWTRSSISQLVPQSAARRDEEAGEGEQEERPWGLAG
ncbi:hypothetical protein TESG_08375 [Trichophyton tonsurans CBS 112818]|uniref:Uncharacterized protein n=1 Tax=Trichophyton tonsurans (strain CBS 112818) TaxID=647933 RepID=F2RVD7_TRIT1|nr:hypothetical protein TESG_08375 [Trichophyton tonsurans CBS 112818]